MCDTRDDTAADVSSTVATNSQESSTRPDRGRYKFVKHIGSGSFGDIYLARDRVTDQVVAVKLERADAKNPQLSLEYALYRHRLQGHQGFPTVKEYWRNTKFSFFAMSLLGDNLEKLFEACDRHFSQQTVLMIAEQLVARLETFHQETGHVHRDIKPENLLMGMGQFKSTLYLVDLGLAKPFLDPDQKHIVARKMHRSLTGTARYASVNAHLGRDQSRRDDLESAAYVLIYLSVGRLPWQGVTGDTKKERYEKICHRKLSTTIDQLCMGKLDSLRRFLTHVRMLRFDEKPDYRRMRYNGGSLFLVQANFYKSAIFQANLQRCSSQTEGRQRQI